jgi:hypothetical protein
MKSLEICRTLASVQEDGNGNIGKIYGKAASPNDSCLCPGICGGHGNPRLANSRSSNAVKYRQAAGVV